MMTVTDEMTKTDNELVILRSNPARDELAPRIEWRRRHGWPIGGLLRPHAVQRAPEPTLDLLVELGVPGAEAEAERRRLSGERKADG